jgi:hypothetical protein
MDPQQLRGFFQRHYLADSNFAFHRLNITTNQLSESLPTYIIGSDTGLLVSSNSYSNLLEQFVGLSGKEAFVD